jgi:hypothetical protein
MDFVDFMRTFGFPAGCLVALSLAVWRVLTWVGVNVVKPVGDRVIKFLDDQTIIMNSLVDRLNRLEKAFTEGLDKQTASLSDKLDSVKASVTTACKVAHEDHLTGRGDQCETDTSEQTAPQRREIKQISPPK